MEELIQLNVRIPVKLKAELIKYVQYMEQPEGRRPTETEDWPDSLSAVARQALEHFLYTHPRHKRSRIMEGASYRPPATLDDPNDPLPISRLQPKRRKRQPLNRNRPQTTNNTDTTTGTSTDQLEPIKE